MGVLFPISSFNGQRKGDLGRVFGGILGSEALLTSQEAAAAGGTFLGGIGAALAPAGVG